MAPRHYAPIGECNVFFILLYVKIYMVGEYMREIISGNIYRHYKGNYYYVKEVVYDSETCEPFVVYQALYDENKTWIRKLSMFLEGVDVNIVDNVTNQKYRFELVNLKKEDLK